MSEDRESLLPANYRPILNLSAVSKVFERLMLTCLHQQLLGSVNFSLRRALGIERIDPLHILTGCRKRRLKQALSILSVLV